MSALPTHLQELLRRRLSGQCEREPILPAARSGPLPLSFSQQRLWFLNELRPGDPAYNCEFALRLVGPLDLAALTSAVEALVARHESLRTTFDEVDGEGTQVVHSTHALPMPLVDLSGSSGPGAAELELVLSEESSRPFDLRRGPLFRALLIRLSDDEHVVLLSAHHIVIDGWSMGVMRAELGALYDAALLGEQPALAPLPVQYGDFAVWQRTQSTNPVLEQQLGYWQRQLAATSPLELPTDRSRPAVPTSAGALHTFVVPPPLVDRIDDLARTANTTMFTILMSACQVLFARYAGQDDVALGTVVSGRNRPELESIVGFFVNTLVLRARVDESLTFSEFLNIINDLALDAFANDELPFERVVEAVHPERDISHNPLFDVMVVLQEAKRELSGFANLRVADVRVPRSSAIFDIVVSFEESDGALAGIVEYNTDLFDVTTIARMTAHLTLLLERIVAAPDRRLGELTLISDHERDQVLVGWNDTDREIPMGTLAELFAEQVARTPDATAVVAGEVELSYAELDARANRLARLLIDVGVGPEEFVALVLPRSVEMIVAVMAVAKAGGGFVPVDVDYPADRIGFIFADVQPVVVVTTSTVAKRLPAVAGMARVVLDHTEAVTALAGHSGRVVSDADRISPLMVAHPAYVIYTSGSTGRPKGVVVTHSGLASFAAAEIARYAVAPGDRVLALSSPSFDASVLELCM
ncbi:MAG: condensation domain-containing protein, partial [Pseudonocardiaceae bacterium]